MARHVGYPKQVTVIVMGPAEPGSNYCLVDLLGDLGHQ